MKNEGWIKIYRKLLEDAVWKLKPEQKVIFLTMLMKANHAENEWIWQGQKLKCMPGQFITSLESLASASGPGISIRNVRTAINNLQNLQILTNESTKTGRLVTICNWDRYQGIDDGGRQSKRQSGDKEVTTNKNYKNDEDTINTDFDDFWNLFHSITGLPKTDKEAALRYWKRLNKIEQKNAVENIQPYYDSLPDKKFCKKARTYLHDKNFNDEFILDTATHHNQHGPEL